MKGKKEINDSELIREKLNHLFYSSPLNQINNFAKANYIIINPSALIDIFLITRVSTSLETNDILSLFKFLNKILLKQPINCLVVYSQGILDSSGLSRKSVPNYLIEYYYEIKGKNGSKILLDEIEQMLMNLVKNNYIEKSIIKTIYQQSLKEYYQGYISTETMENSLSLLHNLIQVVDKNQMNYFFFNYFGGGMGYIPDNKKPFKWVFNNAFSCCMWFYMQELETYESNFPSLFLIHSFQKDGGGIEAYFKGKKLYYRTLSINYSKASNISEGIEIGEFIPNKWYFLAVEHEKTTTFGFNSGILTVYINDEQPKKFNSDYLKIEQGKSISKLICGESFVGKMTNFMIFSAPIKKKVLDIYKKFPEGVYNNSLLEAFKKMLESYKINLFLIYLPNRVYKNTALDLIEQNNAHFFKNTGRIYKEINVHRMSFFGGIVGILPYFYFLRCLPTQEIALRVYNKLLKILILLFNLSIHNQKEAGEQNLLKVIGNLIVEAPFNLISQSSMETLAEMRYSIKEHTLLAHYFLDIVCNISLIMRVDDINLLQDYFKFIRILYLDNPIFFSGHLSISTLLRITIYKLDAKNMECCPTHCLNNGLMKATSQIEKKFNWDVEKILSPLLSIVEFILSHEAMSEDDSTELMQNLLQMLIIRASPCFHLRLLKLLKVLLVDGFFIHLNSDNFFLMINDKKVIHILLYLISNTLCPDIKSLCVKLLNFFLKSKLLIDEYSQKEITSYLSSVLWNLSLTSSQEIKTSGDISSNDSFDDATRVPNLEEDSQNSLKDNINIIKAKSLSLDSKHSHKQDIFTKETIESDFNSNESDISKKQNTKKSSLNLNLNIEKINKEYEKKESSQKIDQEYEEIKKIAIECVKYMKKKEKTQNARLIPHSLIKKDYFKEETNNSSEEEPQNNHFEDAHWNFEPLYNSLMEWLLGKHPDNLESDLLIDDIDQIMNKDVLHLLLEFYQKCSKSLQAKIIQHFYMLMKWNKMNIQITLEDKDFIAWILDILLEQQVILKEKERDAYNIAIWDIGNKVVLTLLKYTIENSTFETAQKIFYILQYMQLKNISIDNANKKNEREISQASKFLLRHIWNNLLESLSEIVHGSKPYLESTIWKNLGFIVYFTLEIVCSVYSPTPLSPGFKQKCLDSYPTLKKCITKLKEGEKIPQNFETYWKEYKFLDFKIIENLFKLLEPLWLENLLNQPISLLVEGEIKRLEKKIENLLDYKHSFDYSQKLEVFIYFSNPINFSKFLLHEPFQNSSNVSKTKGPIIKFVLLFLTLMIDISLTSENISQLTLWLEKMELIFKSLLLMSENARDKPFPLSRTQEKIIVSNILYVFNYLYTINEANKKRQNISELLIRVIKELGLYTIFIIDFLNSKYGGFSSMIKEFKASFQNSNTMMTVHNFIVYEIFNNFLFGTKNNKIITINDIKTLKNEDLLDLHSFVLSNDWIYAFLDNQCVQNIISEHFNENLYLKLSNANRAAIENKESRRKYMDFKDDMKKNLKIKFENDIYNTILLILEMNEERKNIDFYNFEKDKREAKHFWKKIWKNLRINENIWQPFDLKIQNDSYFDSNQHTYENLIPNKYFYFEMWKYEIKNKSRPYLKIKLKEPNLKVTNFENCLNNDNFLNQQQMFNLIHQNFYLRHQQISDSPNKYEKLPPNITENIINLGGKAYNTLKTIVNLKTKNSPLLKSENEPIIQRKCQWITSLTIKTGVFTLTPNKMIFHHDCLIHKNTHYSIMSYKLQPSTPLYKEWQLSSIKEIIRHRFILRKTALNFIFYDGTSLLLNFTDIDPNMILQKILVFSKGELLTPLTNRITNLMKTNICNFMSEKSKLCKQWLNYEISNFEYLMKINRLAGRSYYDITQYPIFPWILSCFNLKDLPLQTVSSELIFRNLSRSMGALGSQERINTFKERFEHVDPFDPVPNYHYGSHYSSPAIIMQYLIRIAPYNQGHKELQGGKFDLADRLFFSFQESYKGATEEISDVRELIPEFYYCPEFLMNLEKYDFGVQQTGNRVHNVKLPSWSNRPHENYNPYNFIKMHRELLENEYVSENVNNWIDLIFGYKQRGVEAANNLNTFFYLTYEDSINLEKIENEKFKVSYESQIIHFGQTPRQIFAKPHAPRPPENEIFAKNKIILDREYKTSFYKYRLKKKVKKIDHEFSANEPEKIVCIQFLSEKRIGILKNNGDFLLYTWTDFSYSVNHSMLPFQFTPKADFKVNLDQKEFQRAQSFFRSEIKCGFMKKGKVLISAGYFDGSLKVSFLDFKEKEEISSSKYDCNEIVTALAIDSKDRFVITGTIAGECVYWKNTKNYKLSIKFSFYDHEGEILAIDISYYMRAFITAGNDQKIFIYNNQNGKLLKSLIHPDQEPVNDIILSSCPLPTIVFYSNQNQTIYSYSINGQLIEKVKEEAIVLNNFQVCKNRVGFDVLIYTTNKGEIIYRNLPYLELFKKHNIQESSNLLMDISKDKKFIIFANAGGEILVQADPTYIPIKQDY